MDGFFWNLEGRLGMA